MCQYEPAHEERDEQRDDDDDDPVDEDASTRRPVRRGLVVVPSGLDAGWSDNLVERRVVGRVPVAQTGVD